MELTCISTYGVESMRKNETAVINGGNLEDMFLGAFIVINIYLGFQEGRKAYEDAKK